MISILCIAYLTSTHIAQFSHSLHMMKGGSKAESQVKQLVAENFSVFFLILIKTAIIFR